MIPKIPKFGFKDYLTSYNLGLNLFHIGIILILSAPTFAALFFLASLILSSLNRKKNYFQSKSNYIFIISGFLLLITTALNSLSIFKHNIPDYEYYLSWIGLFNWIPYFYCLWGFQPYLNSPILRKKTSLYLIIGSIPILITAIGQFWFKWYGPFKTLNGLIIWYQRPVARGEGITGLFNNANYAGSWFVLLLPLLIAFLLNKTNSKFKRLILLLITSLVGVLTYYTKSRNALFGSILSINLITQNKLFFLICSIFILIIIVLVLLNKLAIFSSQITVLIEKFKNTVFFGNFNGVTLDIENFPRMIMLKDSLSFILERPLIGWGSASFPLLFYQKNNIWYGHSHNIIIELAINYGLVCAFLIILGILNILFKSFYLIYIKKVNSKEGSSYDFLYFDKAWWTSSFVLLSSQLFDIQFLDFRISMIFWIFLSGLSTITVNLHQK